MTTCAEGGSAAIQSSSIFAKVVVGVDGSERGQDALMLARELVAPGGELLACCVHRYEGVASHIDPTGPRIDEHTAREVLDGLQEQSDELTVTPVVVSGRNVARVLEWLAVKEDAELIVVGSSHRSRLEEIFPGSVTLELMRPGRCSLATAPNGYRISPRPLRRIGVGCDVREPVRETLGVAVGLCQRTGAELSLIAVDDDASAVSPSTMPYGEAMKVRRGTARKALDEALQTLPASVSVSAEVFDGEPAEILLREGERLDLLLLGSHGRNWLERWFAGSVAEHVVHGLACPALIVASR